MTDRSDAWLTLSQAAAAHREDRRLAEAAALLSGWASGHPDDATARGLLAEVLLLQKDEPGAWAAVDAGLALDPASPPVQRAQARLLLRQGRAEEALKAAAAAHAGSPQDPESILVLATALAAAGRAGEAAPLLDALISQPSPPAGAWLTRAVMRQRQGDAAGAVADAQAAVAARPHLAVAWRLLGSIRFKMRDLDGAVEALTTAASLDPDEAEYAMNLAELHRERGDTARAKHWLDRATARLEAAPDARQLNLQTATLLDRGQRGLALETAVRALSAQDTPEGRSLFVRCMQGLRVTRQDPRVGAFVTRALADPWGLPVSILPAAIGMVRLDPRIEACVQRALAAWPGRPGARDLFGSEGLAALAGDTLLAEVLKSAPVSDLDLERLLTCARRLLLTTAAGGALADALDFHAALATQCFINEYVWGVTDDEAVEAQALTDRVAEGLTAGKLPSPHELLAVAAYAPLDRLPQAERLLAGDFPACVARVVDDQVKARLAEREAAAAMPRLTAVQDETSQRVLAQYEANPYPRWMKLPPPPPARPVDRVMADMFPLAPLAPTPGGDAPEILVAGCGAGQQSIRCARNFLGSRVLAVDLSLPSLAYAARKTAELGVEGVSYAQADLLELGQLGRMFDVIECSGVLHHLSDPAAGAAVLTGLLRPGGVIGLGLYSALARRDLDAAKRLAAEQGYGSSPAEIRRFRQAVIDAPAGDPVRAVVDLGDFFSTSTCRDLLFHVQEHRFSVDQLAQLLRSNGLAFLGFAVEPEVRVAYRREYPDDPAGTNLANWAAFEVRHPRTFLSMYQLWAQKPPSPGAGPARSSPAGRSRQGR